jgi:hypothetical protein
MLKYALPALLLVAGGVALSADKNSYRAREAAEAQAKLDKYLAGLTPGKPVDCIEAHRTYETLRAGDTILYKYSPKLIYRTDTGGGCFGLSRGDAIITESFTSQFCRGDIVRTADLTSHTPSGSCSFGAFIPYTR